MNTSASGTDCDNQWLQLALLIGNILMGLLHYIHAMHWDTICLVKETIPIPPQEVEASKKDEEHQKS